MTFFHKDKINQIVAAAHIILLIWSTASFAADLEITLPEGEKIAMQRI